MMHHLQGELRVVRPGASRSMAVLRAMVLATVAALTLTAGGNPPAVPPGTPHSGTEGAKAALVRIELTAVTEIAHIDHTSGEPEISRGRSTVPLGSATGVLTSADGIVATTWENLAVDEGAVAVYAANELFAGEIGVQVVGNGGNPARRGSTPDPYWRPHLQHCYDQVTHCVLFGVPQYQVRTYTSESGGVMAELLNTPSEPGDVALLRISGGGGAPTATLAAPDAAPGPDLLLIGFTQRPAPEAGPAELPVAVDVGAGRITSSEDLAPPLDAGVSGGPVIDRASGQVLGLSGPLQPGGSATLVPAEAVRTAMTEAGVESSPSQFDAVFRRGIDHLAAGNPGGAAVSALEESLTYYDSALAATHLDRARAMGDGQPTDDPAGGASDAGAEGPLPSALLPVLVGVLLLAAVAGVLVLRRRGGSAAGPARGGVGFPGPGRRSPFHAAARPGIPEDRSGAVDDRAARTTVARADRDRPGRPETGRDGAESVRTEAARDQRSARQRSRAPAGTEADGRRPSADGGQGAGGDETRAAGPLAPRAVDGSAPAFCSQCGRPAGRGARFCSGCGHPIG